MPSIFVWRNKFRRYADDSAWDMIALGLYEYVNGMINIPQSDLTAKELMVEDYLCPAAVIYGFVGAKYFFEMLDSELKEKKRVEREIHEDPDEFSDDHFDEISDDLEDEFPDEYEEYSEEFAESYLKPYEYRIFKAARDTLDQISDKERIFNVLIKGFHCEKEDPFVFFHKLRDSLVARNGGDPVYISKLEKLFLSAGKDGLVINAGDLLVFTMSYMSGDSEEEKKNDFGDIAKYYTDLQKNICEKVICQDTAVRKFISGLFNGRFIKRDELKGPEACFLFVGPPGVGKTFLAQTAAGLIKRPSKVFNMSEYAQKESFHGLIGFSQTYKDSKTGELTSYVSKNENAFLIFDEIEKAHTNTIRLFLSILEGGLLTDLYTEEEVDFTGTIVIFTTNAGRAFYEEKRGMSISSLSEATLIDALKNDKRGDNSPVMPPEILSRMSKGNIVGFDHMDPAKLVPIIKSGMKKAASTVKEITGIECCYDESALPYLFMYHMGGSIDARVASARSESFIKESLFSIAERIGESRKQYDKAVRDNASVRISFEVDEDETAKELIQRDKVPELLVVCNQTDLTKIKSRKYKCYHVYAEKEDNDYRKYIEQQIEDHSIDAIVVDPLMRERKTGKNDGLEGLSHKDTAGNRVIDWLMTRQDHPPVYCVEFKEDYIGFVDQQDLYRRGIKGIIRLSQAKNQSERENMIDSLCYELFLAKKLDGLTSRGRALEFDLSHRIVSEDDQAIIRLFMCNFRLIRSMDSEAQEIFISDEGSNETFDKIIGQEGAKEELRRFIKFIKEPDRYKRSGQQISKGILMYGPPGTGKTMLARALAAEADCPFISATGTQFVVGEKTLSKTFMLARKYAPSIVFIDEIESFAIDSNYGKQHTEILKQLLTEMDGFDNRSKPVFVIAATNAGKAPGLGERNVFLDEALLRRFTKKVYMKWPDKNERIQFLDLRKAELKGREYNLDYLTDSDIEYVAEVAAGRSLSELSNILSVALSRAAELGEKITKEILLECYEEYRYGEKRDYAVEHIRETAIHEAGHAFMGFYCDGFDGGRFTPSYATIISRGGYLGMVSTRNDETRTGYSKEELIKLIRIKLAGRAAEMVFAKESGGGLTTGASNDLEGATEIAAEILSNFAMEDGFLATLPLDIMMNSALANDYYSRLNGILKSELDETVSIITKYRDKVEALADALCDRSRLDTEEMLDILKAKEKMPK